RALATASPNSLRPRWISPHQLLCLVTGHRQLDAATLLIELVGGNDVGLGKKAEKAGRLDLDILDVAVRDSVNLGHLAHLLAIFAENIEALDVFSAARR